MSFNLDNSQAQKTIKKEVSISGIGLHTGVETTATFKPVPANHGVRFKRLDLEDCPEILAMIDNVTDISRGTTISKGAANIHTVEHVLAAVFGLQIDNVIIELTGKEPPVMDGSAKPFVDKLMEAGIVEQNAKKEELIIDETITYSEPDRGVDIHVLPSDRFRITFMADYEFGPLGAQYTAMYGLAEEFVEEFSSARTFCFLSEIEPLKAAGLIQGGSADNALVFIDRELQEGELDKLQNMFSIKHKLEVSDEGLMNGMELRYPNEPVRHKVLDMIGDLALIGMPIRGHFIAARSGHAANVSLVRKIKEVYKKNLADKERKRMAQNVKFDIHGVMNILPHRYPFLLIDRVLDLQPGKVVHALKNVTMNEPFSRGISQVGR